MYLTISPDLKFPQPKFFRRLNPSTKVYFFSNTSANSRPGTTKENLNVAGHFAQTLLADVVHPNSVKAAFLVAKLMFVFVSVSVAHADYYIRQSETTKMSLHDVSLVCGEGS